MVISTLVILAGACRETFLYFIKWVARWAGGRPPATGHH